MKPCICHYIIGDFGRMGRRVAREFSTQHAPFVVIDKSPDLAAGFGCTMAFLYKAMPPMMKC